jgi:hypothetical protein
MCCQFQVLLNELGGNQVSGLTMRQVGVGCHFWHYSGAARNACLGARDLQLHPVHACSEPGFGFYAKTAAEIQSRF